jgi:hypothetical protein
MHLSDPRPVGEEYESSNRRQAKDGLQTSLVIRKYECGFYH